jgi:hypothetical protein
METGVVDAVYMPRQPTSEQLRDFYFPAATRLTFGLTRWRDAAVRFLGIPLLSVGAPIAKPGGWDYPITGGLLSRGAAGRVEIRWAEGICAVAVVGYRPWLPSDVYRATQAPFHRFVTRLALLRLRGRIPSAGVPATPAGRAGAVAVDLVVCLALARDPRRLLPVLALYHLAGWSVGGRTVGARLFRQRLVAVDGSLPTFGQALIRLGALPIAAIRLRAAHDEAASTDVVADR